MREPGAASVRAVLVLGLLGLSAGAGCGSTDPATGPDAPLPVFVPVAVPAEAGPAAAAPAAADPLMAAVPVGAAGGPAVAGAPAGVLAAVDAATALAGRLDGLVEKYGDQQGMVTHFHRVRHISGQTLIQTLGSWKSAKGRLINYPELNMVIITDTPEHMEMMERVLGRIDSLTPQVEIEAKVIEIKRSNSFEYGFEIHFEKNEEDGGSFRTFDGVFDSPSFLDSLLPGRAPNPSPHAFQGALAGFSSVGQFLERYGPMDVVIQALVEEGYAEILSAPRIVVHNGETAELNTVTEIPIQVATLTNNATTIQTVFKPVGIKLKVKPELIGTDAILLEINPEVSSITGFTQVGNPTTSEVPVISSRNARTKVDVKDGETLVLGGLYEKRVVNKERRIPILGSIPGLGHFFTARQETEERTEIIFILRSTILDDVDRTRARLRVPGAR